jgi:hypothetical protein
LPIPNTLLQTQILSKSICDKIVTDDIKLDLSSTTTTRHSTLNLFLGSPSPPIKDEVIIDQEIKTSHYEVFIILFFF